MITIDSAAARVRCGSGVVTGVSGVNPTRNTAAHVHYELYRVTILIDPPVGKPGAMRYTVIPNIELDQPELLEAAITAATDKQHIEWTIEWSRLPHVPDDIPFGALNFARDTVAQLTSLSPSAADHY